MHHYEAVIYLPTFTNHILFYLHPKIHKSSNIFQDQGQEQKGPLEMMPSSSNKYNGES